MTVNSYLRLNGSDLLEENPDEHVDQVDEDDDEEVEEDEEVDLLGGEGDHDVVEGLVFLDGVHDHACG